jgi:diguanylate cyclase (GGDEF)-like protein
MTSHAMPDDYRLHVTRHIFSLIAKVGESKSGTIHVRPESQTYRASPGAVELLGLVNAEGKLSAINHKLGKDGADAKFAKGILVFKNAEGVTLRLRRLPQIGEEAIFFVEDMTTIHNREFEVVEQGRDIRGIFNNAPFGIYRSTVDGRPIRCNAAMVTMNGFDNEEELFESIKDTGRQWYVDPSRRKTYVETLNRDGIILDFVSEVNLFKSGTTMWVSESAWIYRDYELGIDIIEGTAVDATSRVMQEKALREAAMTDALTGLANRAAYRKMIDTTLKANRHKESFAVVLIDLDRFKDINDIFGHARGDQFLTAMSKRIQASMPSNAFFARLGGDEFAAFLPCDTQGEDALALANELLVEISRPILIDGSSHTVGASFGISLYPEHAQTAEDLTKAADMALYNAKNRGRGLVAVFNSELADEKRAQVELINDLRGAHTRGELELYYQSVVDARTGEPVGLEALMRWRHPVRGLVPPLAFVPAAEEAGLMVDFGNWAINEACRHAKSVPEHLSIAVNVSAVQFYSADLVKTVSRALSKNGVSASRLELEVTESFVLRNESLTLHILEDLRNLGVRIVLDDFGTGYSSLSYLQRFHFDKVKIDKSFVRSLKTSGINTAIVRAVLSIGRDLGLSVVAEGIETESERDALLHEGCPLFQGFYYSRPQPFSDVIADLQAMTLRATADDMADGQTEPKDIAEAG